MILQSNGVDAGYLVTQMFNGLVIGMILVLIALGLSIIFGMLGVINFAHGDLLLVGTYVAWATTTTTGRLLIGIAAAVIVVAALGAAIELTMLRRIYDRPPFVQLLLTVGLAEMLRASVQIVWGSQVKHFPIPAWGTGSVDLFLFTYPTYRVLVVVITTTVVVATYLVLERTDIGMIIRAGTYDREMAQLLGTNTLRLFLLVFAFGTGLAGLAGGLIGPIRDVYPLLGINLLIPAFAVVIIGGVGSFRGSVASGLLIGQVIAVTGLFSTAMSNVVIYILMALVLLVRPHGLFGTEGVFE